MMNQYSGEHPVGNMGNCAVLAAISCPTIEGILISSQQLIQISLKILTWLRQ